MKKLFCGIWLTLLLSSHVWARDVNTVKAEIIVFYAGIRGTPITIKETIKK